MSERAYVCARGAGEGGSSTGAVAMGRGPSEATWLTAAPDPSSAPRPQAAFPNSVACAFILFQTT